MPLTKGTLQGTWRAYYYDRKLKKQVWVPLAITSLWDGLAREAADARFAEWLADSGISKVRSRRRSVSQDLETLFLEYRAYLRDMRGAERGTTTRDEESRLRTYAVEYFVRHKATNSVSHWWQYTQTYGPWLRATYPDLKILTVKKLCQAVRRFGEYLAGRGIISQPWLVPAPKTRERRKTPLTKRLTPEEILSVSAALMTNNEPMWALFVSLTYFATLRPEETYALSLSDFLTGATARSEAHTYARLASHGLGSGLSIHIHKTHIAAEPAALTKTHYATGITNIWSADGAKFIAGVLRGLPPGRLFPGTRSQLNAGYRALVKPLLGVNAKDIQRAAGFYLGRVKGLDPILLKDVFRHSVITTTMLYIRRPEDETEAPAQQDFTDVG